MRLDKAYCQRSFGPSICRLSRDGSITITGQTYRITGYINSKAIQSVKTNNWLPKTDPEKLLIVTDDPIPSANMISWIYNRVLAGKFDHLINEKKP